MPAVSQPFPLTLITELLWLTMPSARPSDIFFTRIYRHLWINDALLWCHRKFHVWKRYQTTRKPIILFMKKVPKCSYWRTRQFISETGISFCVITTRSHPWLPPLFCQKLLGLKRYTRSVLWLQGLDFECSELKVLFERATDSCHPSYLRKSDLGLF